MSQDVSARLSQEEFQALFDRCSNWGRWGPDDERGTLNLITPEHTRRAATLVREWAAVQRRLARSRLVPQQASGHYLLTGILRCPACGSRMSGWRRQRPRYRCDTGHRRTCWFSVLTGEVDGPVLAETAAIVDRIASSDARLRAALRRAWDRMRQPTQQDETTKRVAALRALTGVQARSLTCERTTSHQLQPSGRLRCYEAQRRPVWRSGAHRGTVLLRT